MTGLRTGNEKTLRNNRPQKKGITERVHSIPCFSFRFQSLSLLAPPSYFSDTAGMDEAL